MVLNKFHQYAVAYAPEKTVKNRLPKGKTIAQKAPGDQACQQKVGDGVCQLIRLQQVGHQIGWVNASKGGQRKNDGCPEKCRCKSLQVDKEFQWFNAG